MQGPPVFPLRFSIDYPDRELDRVSTLLRPLLAIPIVVVLASVFGTTIIRAGEGTDATWAAGGLLVAGPLLMIVFRRKYPRWWYEWNVEFLRFANRVAAHLALMDDPYRRPMSGSPWSSISPTRTRGRISADGCPSSNGSSLSPT